MTSLAGATIKTSPALGKAHTFVSEVDDRFLMADINNLFTLAKRINSSWIAGTPTTRTKGITDIVCSPEVVANIRAMAYNPVNTKDADGSSLSAGDFPIAATDELRNDLYRNAGVTSFMGLNILEYNEMGKDQKFNTLFGTAASTTEWSRYDNVAQKLTFDGSTDEIVVGVDRTRDSLIRAVATDAENGSEFTLIADDQYSIRQNKIGYFGSVEEGRVVLDNRVLMGVIVGAID
tara:strand:- start:399 stop:1100 length:702 start_codon:yes stop_codon:yes gene_type:complete